MKWQNLTPRIIRAFIGYAFTVSLLAPYGVGQPSATTNPLLKKCWTSQNESGITRLSASDNARVMIFTEEVSKVGALDPFDGKQIWLTDLGGRIASNITVDQSIAVFATVSEGVTAEKAGSGSLRAVSTETGVTVWTASLPHTDRFYLNSDEKFVYSVASSGIIAAFNKNDGAPAWKTDLASLVTTSPAFSKDLLAVGMETGEIVLISRTTGERSHTVKVGSPVASVALISDSIISGDKKGNLVNHSINQGNSGWKFKSGAQVSSITVTSEGLLVSSYDNFLYLIGADNGNVLWKRRLSGRLLEKPEIFETTAALTVLGEPGASLIDLKNGRLSGKTSLAGDEDPIELVLIGSTVILADEKGIQAFSAAGCAVK